MLQTGGTFFAPPALSAGSFPELFWVDFSLLVNLFSLGFAIGSVYRRFGNVGLLTFFAFAFPLLIPTFRTNDLTSRMPRC
jgi:hypothetical protein